MAAHRSEQCRRFRQINLEVQTTHHALEFSDGTVVPLTQMLPGAHAIVLQLPSGADGQRGTLDHTESLASSESYEYQESQIR
jgi:hypothetical protein